MASPVYGEACDELIPLNYNSPIRHVAVCCKSPPSSPSTTYITTRPKEKTRSMCFCYKSRILFVTERNNHGARALCSTSSGGKFTDHFGQARTVCLIWVMCFRSTLSKAGLQPSKLQRKLGIP